MASGLAEILRSLRCERRHNDRRRSPRMGLRERISVESLERRRSGAWLRDISEGGACVLVAAELHVDQHVVLHLPAEAGEGATMPVLCRVVHCQKMGSSCYRVGVQFIQKPWSTPKSTIIAPGPREQRLGAVVESPAVWFHRLPSRRTHHTIRNSNTPGLRPPVRSTPGRGPRGSG